jgi:FixJ family two-component response regulator
MSRSTQIYVAVVDDDESLRRSLSRLLRAAGFQSVTYPSAEDFLADDKKPQFDCLVLDIQLQGMSGLELSQRLAAVSSATPVIINTDHDEPDLRKLALQTGCTAYLRKSESGEKVLATIAEAVGSGLSRPACF